VQTFSNIAAITALFNGGIVDIWEFQLGEILAGPATATQPRLNSTSHWITHTILKLKKPVYMISYLQVSLSIKEITG
jgi:hypothetical protein